MRRIPFPALTLAGLLALSLSLPCLGSEAAQVPAPAAPWYAQAQSYVTERNIMSGMGDDFDPYGPVNRAMMIQALWNMEGRPLQTDVAQFADVDVSAWYQDSAAWAQNAGIALGEGLGNYNPQDTITRGEMATLLYRYAQHKGRDVYSVDPAAVLAGYTDALSVPDYAAAPMGWAVSVGIMNGRSTESGQQLDPTGTAARAELAALLMRADRMINGGEDLLASQETPSPAGEEPSGDPLLPPDASAGEETPEEP